MNAYLRARTAFGFEYLISFRAEHSDADRDITGIEGLFFQNRPNRGEVNTISQIFPKTGRINGSEVYFMKRRHTCTLLLNN